MPSRQWLYPIFQFRGYRVSKCEKDEYWPRLQVEPQRHKILLPGVR